MNIVCKYSFSLMLAAGLLLSGCKGGSSSSSSVTSPANYTISGTVTGLAAGQQVTLLNNAGDAQTVNSGNGFSFDVKVAQNGSYAVTVGTQPTEQTCTVNNGSGTKITTNVTNVAVICSVDTYTVSGAVTGLNSGEKVTLLNSGANPTTVTSNVGFSFSMPVAYGGNAVVTVGTAPPGQSCTVTNGNSTATTVNVTNVTVTCSAATETVIHSFAGALTDGNGPNGDLTLGSDGNFYGVTYSGGANNFGTIFKVTPAGVETVLHSFAGGTTDGLYPGGDLTLGSDGNFYGMTYAGGANNLGAIFKVTPAGAETLIYSFTGGTGDGSGPAGNLTLGSDGNFYGATDGGGLYGIGTIFKVTPAGVETMLYSFAGGTTDGAYPNGYLTLGSDGNFYGVTNGDGAYTNGTIFKVTPAGIETTLYSFANGTSDGYGAYGYLTLGTDGNFYGLTSSGGANNMGIVFKVTPAGVETPLYSFAGGTSDGSSPYGYLTLGSDGNFYGLTSTAGTNNSGTIFMVTPAGVETTLYSFGATGDGSLPNASLTLGSDGHFYGLTNSGGAQVNNGGSGTVFRY